MPRQPIQAWLTDTNRLQNLLSKAHYLNELSLIVRDYLAENLAAHCQVANYEAGRLKLLVDSSVWASQLRFCLPTLCKTLQAQPPFTQLQKIEYSVQTLYQPQALPKLPKAQLSSSSAELVASMAQSISDPKLQQALLRLANSRIKTLC